MKRVLIADDHQIVRAGLRQIIAETEDFEVVGEASDGRETLNLVQRLRPDVLVLDVSMPGLGGLDVLAELTSMDLELPVLVLSMYPEKEYAIRALKTGASGYLTKDAAPEELVTALSRITAGHRYITPALSEVLAEQLTRRGDGPPHQDLSDREFQVLRQLAKGLSIKEIGAVLCLSPKTVSTYRGRLLAKMRMTNNAELTRYAVEHSLVD